MRLSIIFIVLLVIGIFTLPLTSSQVKIKVPPGPNIFAGNFTNFTQLFDTPSGYSGSGGLCLKVNAGATSIEFDTCTAGSGDGSYNATYTIWAYNQTQPAINYINSIGVYYSDEDWINKNSTNAFIFNESKLTTTYYNATQVSAIVGTVDGVTLGDTQHQDGAYDGVTFNFTEESGSPGLDLRMNFTGIISFNAGVIRYKTSNLFGGYPIIQLWNYDDSAWEDYPPLGEIETFHVIEQPVFDSTHHVSGGVVQMRLYKATNGNINNHYYVDWVAISKGYGTPAGEEVDPHSIHRDGSTPWVGNEDGAGYNSTFSNFFGNVNWSWVQNAPVTSWVTTFNTTYAPWSYNQTTPAQNYADTIINQTFNQSLTDLLYADILWSYNQSSPIIDWVNSQAFDSTYNETYALWAYNQSAPVITWINAQGFDSTFNSTYLSTFNATYAGFSDTDTNYFELVEDRITNATTAGLNITAIEARDNITAMDRVCFTNDCAVNIYYNGSRLIFTG